MIDAARDWMNNNSSLVTVLAVALLIGSLAFLVSRRVGGGGGGTPGQAWYYDTVTKEYFTDEATKIAPFKRDNGNDAVKVHYFSCGECTDAERFVGYYEKYTDEAKKKFEAQGDQAFMMYEMMMTGRLYSVDGEKWVEADKPEGIRISSDLNSKCPPKKLRYCAPE